MAAQTISLKAADAGSGFALDQQFGPEEISSGPNLSSVSIVKTVSPYSATTRTLMRAETSGCRFTMIG